MRYFEPLPTCIPTMYSYFKPKMNNDIFVRRIAKIIELAKGCNPLNDTSNRTRCLCEARQVLLVMLTIHTKWTLNKIGFALGKDHSTVIHAKKTIANLCETNVYFKEQFDTINQQIKECCKYNQ